MQPFSLFISRNVVGNITRIITHSQLSAHLCHRRSFWFVVLCPNFVDGFFPFVRAEVFPVEVLNNRIDLQGLITHLSDDSWHFLELRHLRSAPSAFAKCNLIA